VWTQVLNVENLIVAALSARSAESVQAAIDSLVSWVEINARNKRLCFISGERMMIVGTDPDSRGSSDIVCSH
jgi:hypothetical protein